jgi:hypothetical protein
MVSDTLRRFRRMSGGTGPGLPSYGLVTQPYRNWKGPGMTVTTTPNDPTNTQPKETLGEKASATYASAKESVTDAAAKSRDAVAEAAKTTAETVKAHPAATAAIVAGAAAAIAGAAFGASKLLEKKKEADAAHPPKHPKPPVPPKPHAK